MAPFKDDETAVFNVHDVQASRRASTSQRDRAVLTVLSGAEVGTLVRIEQDCFVIGRAQDANLTISDDGISRRHAEIRRIGDDYVVRDLDSRNGTFIDGVPVNERTLSHGDRLQLGRQTILQFTLADELEEGVQRQLIESATRDALTGLFNRRHFEERALAEFSYAMRHGSTLSVIMLDLDHFKNINDTYGHLAGDAVLRVLGAAVRKMIRTEDFAARYGGEEVVLLVRGIDARNIEIFAERLRRSVERLPVSWEGRPISVTVSVGAATMDAEHRYQTTKDLVGASDACLYRAKFGGRNRVVVT